MRYSGRRCPAAVGLLVVAWTSLVASAGAHGPHTPMVDPGVIASPSLSLMSSTFACSGDPQGRIHNHGGDIAFWKDIAVLACSGDDAEIDDDGIAVLDVEDPRHPRILSRFACVGSASDVAIWDDLVFTAVDTNQESGPGFAPGAVADPLVTPAKASGDCDAAVKGRVPGNLDEDRFAGIHIISIADPANPVQVGAVATNTRSDGRRRGAHGLSLVPDPANGRLLIYAATYPQPVLDIVEVPLDRPQDARVLPHLQFPAPGTGCHDIAIFLPRRLAACASPAGDPRDATKTVLYSIADPVRPVRKGEAVANPSNGRRDHSATFSWDGETMIVTDENLASAANNECRPDGGLDQGALWFYDVRDADAPKYLGSHGPHPVADVDWCHPKQLNVVPLRSGDDVLVASWFGGGTTLIDFTALSERGGPPREIAHYVVPRGGLMGAPLNRGYTTPWSSYWHNGYVYAHNAYGCLAAGMGCLGNPARGLDVMRLRLRDDPSLPPDDRERLTDAFDEAMQLPWFNSYVQPCLPAGFGEAHGNGEAAAACAD